VRVAPDRAPRCLIAPVRPVRAVCRRPASYTFELMVLRNLERRLERLVEGTFARAFRSSVRPVELGRRLARTMDDERTVDVRGATMAPNHFAIGLAEADYERFGDVRDVLRRELVDFARQHARERSYGFMGPVDVVIYVDKRMHEGQFNIESQLRQGVGGSGAGALILGDGGRVELTDQVVVIGRMSDCQIVVDDPSASRRHVEIRPDGGSYLLADLGSTNGTHVNGVRVERHMLMDGDQIGIGSFTVRFEAS